MIGILDSSIKQYADSLYEKTRMESATTIGRESKAYLLERSKTQDERQLFSGVDYQAMVKIYASHIERCTAARLDSYQRTYSEIKRLPTEGELTEILDDFKATWELQIKHSTHALSNFLAARNAPAGLDVCAGLRATSAHGHDRVLGEWKIWRDRVKLQRSLTGPTTTPQDNVSVSPTVTLPEEREGRVSVPEVIEHRPEQGIRRFSHLSGHGLIALFFAFVLGALAVSGITSTNIGHVLWFFAWLAGSVFILAEVLQARSLRYRLLFCGVLGAAIIACDLWIVRSKRQQDSPTQTTQQVPTGSQTRPPTKQLNNATQSPTETHGTIDSVDAKGQRHGTADAVTAKVGHKQGVLKLTFQDSPAFTLARIERLSRVLNDYYDYLTFEVGLELPKELPPIGVSPKGAVSLTGGQIGAAPYYSHIIISEDSIDNDDAVRADYSFYIFQELLSANPPNNSVQQFNSQVLWLFTCHFSSSFSGKKICSIDVSPAKWIDAMWEMGRVYGKHYVDRVLGFTLRMWATSSPGQWKDFDQFFMNKLLAGETVMNGDPVRFNEVRELVKRHGIQID